MNRGRDLAEVRAYVAELTNLAAEVRHAAFAQAEDAAEEICRRAIADGRRARSRAADDGRQLLMEGRRDALDIVAGARCTADAIVCEAEVAEAEIQARMRRLRRVVERTEGLLGALANGDPLGADPGEPPVGEESETSSQVVVTADQARSHWRLGDTATSRGGDLPYWLRHLLDHLRTRDT